VVATGRITVNEASMVFWSKNSPVEATNQEKAYIDHLIQKPKRQEKVDSMLPIAIKFCKAKVAGRCKKHGVLFMDDR